MAGLVGDNFDFLVRGEASERGGDLVPAGRQRNRFMRGNLKITVRLRTVDADSNR